MLSITLNNIIFTRRMLLFDMNIHFLAAMKQKIILISRSKIFFKFPIKYFVRCKIFCGFSKNFAKTQLLFLMKNQKRINLF